MTRVTASLFVAGDADSGDDKDRAADRNHHVRAQAGPMTLPFALQADRAAEKRGRADASKVVPEDWPFPGDA